MSAPLDTGGVNRIPTGGRIDQADDPRQFAWCIFSGNVCDQIQGLGIEHFDAAWGVVLRSNVTPIL